MTQKIIKYEAMLSSGDIIKGVFEGSAQEFEKLVAKKKFIIISTKEVKKKLDQSKFSNNDFLAFIEELHYLTKSGMTIDHSINMCTKTAQKESQIRIFKNILNELKNGSQLSVSLEIALKKENFNIDPLSISFISTAEEVGDISNGLFQLFEYLTFQKKIRSDIYQALSYPIFLIFMSFGVALLIFFLIIPKFSTIFTPEEFAKLPSISYWVLSLGKNLNAHASEFFIILFMLVALLIFIYKNIQISWISLFYKIPKLSTIIADLQLTILYSAMSTMLTGGLELDKALKQMQKIHLLPELNDLIRNTLFELKKGQKFSTIFSMSKIIPSSDIALLYVGENSASLSTIFKSLSLRHSDAFHASVKKFLALLEPIVIVALGIFVAFIVVSIMMAVMSITDVVG